VEVVERSTPPVVPSSRGGGEDDRDVEDVQGPRARRHVVEFRGREGHAEPVTESVGLVVHSRPGTVGSGAGCWPRRR
jgi:hypothetical protein